MSIDDRQIGPLKNESSKSRGTTLETDGKSPPFQWDGKTDAPAGFIPRVEIQWSHERFVNSTEPPQVMISIISARKLIKRGHTAKSYFPDGTSVITTTTINDTQLYLTSREQEWNIIKRFQPDYHVPADHSVYRDLDEADRAKRLARCITGTKWVQEQIINNADEFDSDPPTLLPLIKGTNPAEREPFYKLASSMNSPLAMYYCSQYFSEGRHVSELRRDIQLANILAPDDLPLCTLGLSDPTVLANLPTRVVAAAGFHTWSSEISPRKDQIKDMQEKYAEIENRVERSLNLYPKFTTRSLLDYPKNLTL